MKKLFSILLCALLLLSICSLGVSAEEKPDISKFEFPTPEAPHYMIFDAADRTATEGDDMLSVIRKSDPSVVALSAEWDSDSDAFREKYGLYDFLILMQYDTSLDGTDNWNYTPEWDTNYAAMSTHEASITAWIGGNLMERETLFDLYHRDPENNNYSNMEDAIIRRDVPYGDYVFTNHYFDYENHSLYVRCRYYMEWQTYDGETIGEKQSMVSEWSDVAVFGKNGTAITPEEPTGYAAPIIADLSYVQPGERDELGYLTYMLTTPASVWNAAIYYEMTGDGNFDNLETQISVDGSDWQPYSTANDWADWGLTEGIRTAHGEEPRIEADSHIKLRIRYTGSHGVSEWSNVLELNDGGTQKVPEDTTGKLDDGTAPIEPADENKCSLCGFCPVPLGLCIFIWLAILLAIVIVIVVIILLTKPKKCKNCGEKLKKEMKCCPKCGTRIS